MALTAKLWFALALLLILNVVDWGSRGVAIVDAMVAGLMALKFLAAWLWPTKVGSRPTTRGRPSPKR